MTDTSDGRRGEDAISAVLSAAVDNRAVPGILAVISDADRVVYRGAFGAAQHRAGIPVAADTIYRIASMTKLMTSVAVMMLVDEQRVSLDTPFREYVKSYQQPEVLVEFEIRSGTYQTRPALSDVTVRQLLSHTSGYGYWFLNPYLKRTQDQPPDLINAPFLIDEPGAAFHYGTSTDVLAQLIEPVSGLPFAEFLRRRIIEPLGMLDTSFALPQKTDRLASLFKRNGQAFTEMPLETIGPAPRGGGGLYSTADDYCRFLRVFLNDGINGEQRLLSSDSIQAMTSNQLDGNHAPIQKTAFAERTNDFIFMNGTQGFGLGVAIETENQPTGRPAGSFGWAGINNTYYWVDPQNEFAAVAFMQVQPFSDPSCVGLYQAFERVLYDCLAV